ncbi:flp operon protein C [Pasteurellaceae bacterium LIM206]|nr:flp operon protein C [Pasteurellaceae bacterium LIM206]
MNYRVLFFISGLIIAVGLGGLFFAPSSNTDSTTEQTAEKTTEEKEMQTITTATLTRDIKQGTLLRADDYVLSELTVDTDSALLNNDLKELIDNASHRSLQGFLVTENLQKDSLLSKNTVVSPEDPRFLVSSLNTNNEVAYRIYFKPSEAYLLDTVLNGSYVSIFGQQTATGDNSNQDELVKIIDKVLVLQNKTFTEEESKAYDNQAVGYIAVKIDAEQVQKLYSTDKEIKLIILPTDKTAPTNHHGKFIKKLRGQ